MDLVYQLALQFGKGKLTEAAISKAMQVLGVSSPSGLDRQVSDLTGGGISGLASSFSPFNMGNMFKRGAINMAGRALTGGLGSSGLGVLTPLALGAGVIGLLNKNREKLTGYKTQQAYEDARNQRRADKRLDKITDRMVAGKNYGNYKKALLGSGAGAVDVDGVIMSGADYFPEPGYRNFDDKFESIEDIVVSKPAPAPVYQGGGGRDSGSTPSPSRNSQGMTSAQHSAFRMARGGLASL